MPTLPVVEIMTIGDELLYGQVIDTNSAFMGQELGKLGLRVRQITSVSDRADEIVAALDLARQRADIVLMTGGLGPTKDDLTKHVLARYFGVELVLHEPTLLHVEAIFARYNRPMLEVNRQQALVPSNCTVLHNALGTAPGMWFEDGGTIFVSMPGVPFEMKGLMKDEVLPRLQQHFQTPPIEHLVIQTSRIWRRRLLIGKTPCPPTSSWPICPRWAEYGCVFPATPMASPNCGAAWRHYCPPCASCLAR
jgi:nicotinamide-nucleotide amidase